jgi:ribosomal protein S18 acetylase RimI-like enzyme
MKEDQLPQIEEPRFRLATPSDADAVAALHADNWRRHYRGAYSDAFLDGDLDGDRLAVWGSRLRDPDAGTYTVIAEDAFGLIGFAHTVFEADRTWGALLDNLHVIHDRKRRGVGSRLLELSAGAVVERGTGLFLWVLEQNVSAQAFYAANGGRIIEREPALPPDGNPARLNGSPVKLRCAWSDPATIVSG